ncbi:alpha-N-acetylgalactosaminidase-like [Haliotis cracherodii]|uniref:alpha-N-acetylgalactosaminidase-like n=1 Tax=Haliotis cracherodii TaxID=6455 RepID=UPI0039E8FE82
MTMKFLTLMCVTWYVVTGISDIAPTPPMGWTTRGLYDCRVNCAAGLETCLSQTMIKQMADTMATDGYRDAGYTYLLIGDCWSEKRRNTQGRLLSDRSRFPDGIASLAQYLHSKNLKLGLHMDLGIITENGYPGSKGHVTADVGDMAAWGVDMIYVDGVAEDVKELETSAIFLDKSINSTGWSPLVSCGWPARLVHANVTPNYDVIKGVCHTFRSTKRLSYTSTWNSIYYTSLFFTPDEYNISSHQGQGRWNDLGLLLLGSSGLPETCTHTQLSFWAMLNSPLFLGSDLRHLAAADKDIVLRKPIIELDQDTLDNTPLIKAQYGPEVQVWHRFLSYADHAVLVVSWGPPEVIPRPIVTNLTLQDAGVNLQPAYSVQDLPSGQAIGHYFTDDVMMIHGAPVTIFPAGNILLKAVSEH